MDAAEALTKLATTAATGVLLLVRGPSDADQPADVLKHPERKRLLEAIRTRPGIHRSALRRGLNLGGGAFSLHVDRLEQAGLIETRAIANRTHYYPTGEAPPSDLEILESPAVRRLARHVVAMPGCTSAEIAKTLGVSQRYARRILGELVDADFVTVVRVRFWRTYEASDSLREAIKQLTE